MSKAPEIAVGDRVAYSVTFLRSTGQRTGSAPSMRGDVRALHDLGAGFVLAEIAWDGGNTSRVNVGNLVTTKRIAIDAALNT